LDWHAFAAVRLKPAARAYLECHAFFGLLAAPTTQMWLPLRLRLCELKALRDSVAVGTFQKMATFLFYAQHICLQVTLAVSALFCRYTSPLLHFALYKSGFTRHGSN
jgi:hypothetical protein